MVSQIKQKGFTIVELLIVIVVIAILAAISIVAYTGIQNNARASERQSDATNIARVAEAIYADTGSYPTAVSSGQFTTTSTTATLPSNVLLTTATTVTIPPTAANASSHPAVATNGNKTYRVVLCSNGANIHYWDPRSGDNGGAKIVRAGQGC